MAYMPVAVYDIYAGGTVPFSCEWQDEFKYYELIVAGVRVYLTQARVKELRDALCKCDGPAAMPDAPDVHTPEHEAVASQDEVEKLASDAPAPVSPPYECKRHDAVAIINRNLPEKE